MQKARGQAFRSKLRHSPPTACRYTVSGTISLPSQGFFSPFPHGTGSLSVTSEYLALPDGPGKFMQNSSCSALLGCQTRDRMLHVRGYHALWQAFPNLSIHLLSPLCLIPRPRLDMSNRFRLFRVRSPLLAESLLFSFPSGTEMVHFPELTLFILCIRIIVYRVPPFGNQRVIE